MLTVGKLKKMIAELEGSGKINDDTIVVAMVDEFNYYYSPQFGKATDMLHDMDESIKFIEEDIKYYEDTIAKTDNVFRKKICQNNIERRKSRIEKYKSYGKVCLKVS